MVTARLICARVGVGLGDVVVDVVVVDVEVAARATPVLTPATASIVAMQIIVLRITSTIPPRDES
ncbi:MAG TPA: hypothetical protein VGL69_01810 [Solirubrobacteraceae bacterium]